MKKVSSFLLLVVFSLVFSQNMSGQVSFSQALGCSLYTSKPASAGGITYSPRLNFLSISDEVTLSVGTHLGFGIYLDSESGSGSLAIDLPLVAELNLGQGANPNTDSKLGGFAGVGICYSKLGSSSYYSRASYNTASGLLLNGGIRFLMMRYGAGGVRVSYLLNSKEEYYNVISLGLFYTFGDY